jgi:hypothetical protein
VGYISAKGSTSLSYVFGFGSDFYSTTGAVGTPIPKADNPYGGAGLLLILDLTLSCAKMSPDGFGASSTTVDGLRLSPANMVELFDVLLSCCDEVLSDVFGDCLLTLSPANILKLLGGS